MLRFVAGDTALPPGPAIRQVLSEPTPRCPQLGEVWLALDCSPVGLTRTRAVAHRYGATEPSSDLRESESPIKVQRYAAGDFHDWHVDLGAHAGRKLGLTVQLSDPDAYEGGDLRLFDPPSHRRALRERRAVTCFPSFLPHEVTPVTSGVRFSLTAWVMGPRFR